MVLSKITDGISYQELKTIDENDKGKQNFKVVPWENIASSFNPPLSNNNKWSIRY